MIQIDCAGTKSFYTAGLFSRKNIAFNISPLLEPKYVGPLWSISLSIVESSMGNVFYWVNVCERVGVWTSFVSSLIIGAHELLFSSFGLSRFWFSSLGNFA